MQFSKDLAEKIMAGAKKQTRRPWKEGEEGTGLYEKPRGGGQTFRYVLTPAGRVKWQFLKVYAVQPGRGKPGIGRIKLMRIRQDVVQNITETDARAEGFAGVVDFRAKWEELYPKGPYAWEQNPLVWVLDFEVVPNE